MRTAPSADGSPYATAQSSLVTCAHFCWSALQTKPSPFDLQSLFFVHSAVETTGFTSQNPFGLQIVSTKSGPRAVQSASEPHCVASSETIAVHAIAVETAAS